jgi:hypothetical protein
MKQDLFSKLKLRRNGSNISIGGRALIPHKGSLNEAVKLRNNEASSLLLRDTILGVLSGPARTFFFLFLEEWSMLELEDFVSQRRLG